MRRLAEAFFEQGSINRARCKALFVFAIVVLIVVCILDVNVGSTSLPGGNQVDGLPPAPVKKFLDNKCEIPIRNYKLYN